MSPLARTVGGMCPVRKRVVMLCSASRTVVVGCISVKGVEYFECRENHGVFARPKGVEQGDFPEIDILADDDEEDDI